MSPVTVAGTAAQTLAEALSGMAFVQLVAPGAPVVLGSFASSISMQSGAPTFGTPEPALVLFAMAALARRLGVPFPLGRRTVRLEDPDAQAAYESANTLLPTCLGGVNFVLHTAGWLEGGLSMGYEKFVMDVDQAGMMHTLLAGVDLSDNGQAMDAIARSAPASTSSAARTRRPTSRRRSTARPSPTTTASSNGKPKAARISRSAPTRAGRSSSRATRPRRSTRGRQSPAGLHEPAQGDVRRFQVLINWRRVNSRSAGVRGGTPHAPSITERPAPAA
jgi:trimethylamine--corrinoid protein Co-methyltransferase